MSQTLPFRQIVFLICLIALLLYQVSYAQDNVKRELTVHTQAIQTTNTNSVPANNQTFIPNTSNYVGQDDVTRSLTIHSYPPQNIEGTPLEVTTTEVTSVEDSSIELTNVELENVAINDVTSTTIEQTQIATQIETIVSSEITDLFTPVEEITEQVEDITPQIQAVQETNTSERKLTVHTQSTLQQTKLPENTLPENTLPENTLPENILPQIASQQSILPQTTEQTASLPQDESSLTSDLVDPVEPEIEPVEPEELPNVGRLMMVAFEQSDTQTQTILKNIQPGGFAFFPGDIVSTLQIQTLTASLQENAEHPLIFAIDQEGGPFTSYRIEDATLFPGAMMLAATNDTELAKRVGEATAKELNYAGLTMNFAPVADVNSNPDNPIIGIRSFGDDPEKVSAFSQAFAEGSVAAGVASVTKHFPGHGNTTMDSHLELPRIESSLEVMRATDLEPFKNNLDSPALMTAHIVFPALDDVWPATLSKTILTDLLRTEMGYEGLVITDSLVMGALTNSFSAGTIAVKAINAGADMLLVGASYYEQQLVYDALQDALETGEIPLWRVKEALGRIDNLATTYTANTTNTENADLEVPDYEAHRQLAIEVALKGTTLVSDAAEVIPVDEALSISVIAPKPRGFGTPPHLGTVLAEFMSEVEVVEISVNPSSSQINNAVYAARDADVIVLGLYYWLHDFPSRIPRLYSDLKSLGKPVVVVSLGNPTIESHLGLEPDAHIAAYGYRYSNLYGASAVLSGAIEAVGTLPLGQAKKELSSRETQ